MENRINKIGLGTVQFGIPYGISNSEGKTSPDEVRRILSYARQKGIALLDTASVYGDSEAVLGGNDLAGFNIVSKFMPPKEGADIYSQLSKSLEKLRVPSLYGYLAHRPDSVISDARYWQELMGLKRRGLVKKIGLSFNETHETEEVLAKGMIPDIIQVPFNYLDKRFVKYFKAFKENGCEIHTRSAFLQGLFFIAGEKLPEYFNIVKPIIGELQKNGERLPAALLSHCLGQEQVDKVIIGVNNLGQLKNLVDNLSVDCPLGEYGDTLPETILMPSRWGKKQ